jgi:uncharacterized protein YxjI
MGDNQGMYLIREKFFDLGDDFDITDESGNKLFHVDGKVLTMRDKLVISDADGREVAEVHRRLVALHRTYEISIGGESAAQVRKHLLTPFRDKFTIDIPGPHDLAIKGSILDHEFTIERDGETVATASKRWISIRDTYAVDIADGENHVLILASVLALELSRKRDDAEEATKNKDGDGD